MRLPERGHHAVRLRMRWTFTNRRSCAARDAQDARHRAAARRQDRADQQQLGMAPGAVDEQRRERQDDPGEAGRQGQHGGVSWRGRQQPIHHARFVTSAQSMRRKWPKSS